MMNGMIQLEDIVISWTIRDTDHMALVKVTQYGPENTEFGQFEAPGEKFMKALATTLTWDGDVPASPEDHQAWWADVESIAKLCDIRWMP